MSLSGLYKESITTLQMVPTSFCRLMSVFPLLLCVDWAVDISSVNIRVLVISLIALTVPSMRINNGANSMFLSEQSQSQNISLILSSNATVPYTDISLYSLRSSKIQLAVWLINHIHIWSLALPHRQKLRHDSIIKYQLRLWSSFRSYLVILCHTLTASFHIEKLWMNYCYFFIQMNYFYFIQMNDFFRVP